MDERSCWLYTLFFILTLVSTLVVVDAANSRRRIVVRREVAPQYDRSITTFSADGRLAQVEYGMEASLRGSTVAALQSPSDDPQQQGICLVLQSGSFGKVHRIDHHLWLVTSGLSGDARTLANALRNSCQNHRLNFGEPPTTKQVARIAGEAQHQLTRKGGARPLGCTALVVGVDPSSFDEEGMGTPRLYQTDPGGIVEECTFCAAGKGRATVGKIVASLADKVQLKDSNSGKYVAALAAAMTERVLEQLIEPKGTPTVDVWIFQPNPGRRGGIQVTCYCDLSKNTVSRIRDSL